MPASGDSYIYVSAIVSPYVSNCDLNTGPYARLSIHLTLEKVLIAYD